MNADTRLMDALRRAALALEGDELVTHLATAADVTEGYARMWLKGWQLAQEAADDLQRDRDRLTCEEPAPSVIGYAGLDPINPSHYRQGDIECIDAIKSALGAGFKDYLRGNMIKYLWRVYDKGVPLQDAKKAQWYLERFIKELEST